MGASWGHDTAGHGHDTGHNSALGRLRHDAGARGTTSRGAGHDVRGTTCRGARMRATTRPPGPATPPARGPRHGAGAPQYGHACAACARGLGQIGYLMHLTQFD